MKPIGIFSPNIVSYRPPETFSRNDIKELFKKMQNESTLYELNKVNRYYDMNRIAQQRTS